MSQQSRNLTTITMVLSLSYLLMCLIWSVGGVKVTVSPGVEYAPEAVKNSTMSVSAMASLLEAGLKNGLASLVEYQRSSIMNPEQNIGHLVLARR